MPSVSRTFTSTSPPDVVFAYLSDFTNAEEWDPGTVECSRATGDGGVGTTYRNVSQFLGRRTTLEYTADELIPSRLVHFIGRNEQFEGHDEISLAPSGSGTEVTYEARFSFNGATKLAAPLVSLYLPKLATKTVDQLRAALDKLVSVER